MKTHFSRLKPTIVNYRHYNVFVNDYFRSELLQEINRLDAGITNFKVLYNALKRVLNKQGGKAVLRDMKNNTKNFNIFVVNRRQ